MRPDIATQVDQTFWMITGTSIVLLLIITVAMLYFLFKYSKKRHPVPEDIEGNTTIEIVWTVIPVILVLIMFFISWAGFKNMRDVPKDAMVVKVMGQMWKWSFEYDNKKKSDTLYLPVNRDVKFEIGSIDVNHSFYLPQFRVKEDAIPGRINYYWIRTNEEGNFYAACAEYCGLNHWNMYAQMVVMPEDKFTAWKNYFPPDTTAAVKTDTLKTTAGTKDTLKTAKDSIKVSALTKDTAAIKKDTVKKDTTKK
jgi:cytochrome c oxidase subunit 2